MAFECALGGALQLSGSVTGFQTGVQGLGLRVQGLGGNPEPQTMACVSMPADETSASPACPSLAVYG